MAAHIARQSWASGETGAQFSRHHVQSTPRAPFSVVLHVSEIHVREPPHSFDHGTHQPLVRFGSPQLYARYALVTGNQIHQFVTRLPPGQTRGLRRNLFVRPDAEAHAPVGNFMEATRLVQSDELFVQSVHHGVQCARTIIVHASSKTRAPQGFFEYSPRLSFHRDDLKCRFSGCGGADGPFFCFKYHLSLSTQHPLHPPSFSSTHRVSSKRAFPPYQFHNQSCTVAKRARAPHPLLIPPPNFDGGWGWRRMGYDVIRADVAVTRPIFFLFLPFLSLKDRPRRSSTCSDELSQTKTSGDLRDI